MAISHILTRRATRTRTETHTLALEIKCPYHAFISVSVGAQAESNIVARMRRAEPMEDILNEREKDMEEREVRRPFQPALM